MGAQVARATQSPAPVAGAGAGGAEGVETVTLPAPLAELERRAVLRLWATGGNKTQAAKLFGVDRVTLYSRLEAYGAPANENT